MADGMATDRKDKGFDSNTPLLPRRFTESLVSGKESFVMEVVPEGMDGVVTGMVSGTGMNTVSVDLSCPTAK
jgi:hypothetical protein